MINVDDIGIKFRMGKHHRLKARDLLVDMPRSRRSEAVEFWALRHISFTVECGETIGIIGRNGSGKSTLLRVIAGIYPPDEGKISVGGEVSTLFSLGAGFQPELSGRDNIYLNGIMIGLTKKTIDSKIDGIIEFAELGDFIDMPMKIYSSGMRSRLGFAIAMHIDKDIILIDEIMGTGDAAFRQKADVEMSRIMGEKTVVIVSHGMATIQKFSNKVIWLNKGIITAMGEPHEVVKQYLAASHIKEPPPDEVPVNNQHLSSEEYMKSEE
jgi:ABC-type polysaccharide/polyol phosphate transport system ATPase subunit